MTINQNKSSTRLTVFIADEDAGLQRLIGLIRRRGFMVTAMEASQDTSGGGGMRVSVCVTGIRPVDMLIRQIEKLIGVRRVGLELAPVAAVA